MINVKLMEIRFLITHKPLMKESLVHVSDLCMGRVCVKSERIAVSAGLFGAHVSEIVLGTGEVLGGVRPDSSEETNCQG